DRQRGMPHSGLPGPGRQHPASSPPVRAARELNSRWGSGTRGLVTVAIRGWVSTVCEAEVTGTRVRRRAGVVGASIATACIAFSCGPGAQVAAAAPPKLPAPTYQSVSMETLVPMDDGVRLAATVYLPSRDGKTPAPGRFPVVLQMTPYGREGVCGCVPGADFATRGIADATVDVRGTGGSEGTLKDNYFSPR